jgi:hypothetical protein
MVGERLAPEDWRLNIAVGGVLAPEDCIMSTVYGLWSMVYGLWSMVYV